MVLAYSFLKALRLVMAKNYSFASVVGALGLNVAPTETPNTLSAKDFVVLRRFVWRNYRLTLGASLTKDGWFTLIRRKKDVSTGHNVRARVIYSKDKALSGALWMAADFAKRNKLGVYAA